MKNKHQQRVAVPVFLSRLTFPHYRDNPGADFAKAKEMITSWLQQKAKNADLSPLQTLQFPAQFVWRHKGTNIRAIAPTPSIWCARLEHPDHTHNRTWRVDLALFPDLRVVSLETGSRIERSVFGVEVTCFTNSHDSVPRSVPKIVKELVAEFDLSDSSMSTSADAWMIQEEQEIMILRQVLIDPMRNLPVFVLTESQGMQVRGTPRFMLRHDSLAKNLYGMALVACVPETFRHKLEESLPMLTGGGNFYAFRAAWLEGEDVPEDFGDEMALQLARNEFIDSLLTTLASPSDIQLFTDRQRYRGPEAFARQLQLLVRQELKQRELGLAAHRQYFESQPFALWTSPRISFDTNLELLNYRIDTNPQPGLIAPEEDSKVLVAAPEEDAPQPNTTAPTEDNSEWVEALEEENSELTGRVEELVGKHEDEQLALMQQIADLQAETAFWQVQAQEDTDALQAARRALGEINTQKVQLEKTLRAQQQESSEQVNFPTDYHSMPEWVTRNLAGRVVLLPKAIRSLRQAVYVEVTRVYRALYFLGHEYRERFMATEETRKAILSRSAQVQKTLQLDILTNDPAANKAHGYSVEYPLGSGQMHLLDSHIRKGGIGAAGKRGTRNAERVLRLYFFWYETEQVIVVGWLPSHLPTGKK